MGSSLARTSMCIGVPYSSVDYADAVEIPVDVPINANRFTPVAEAGWSPGEYCESLTQDDVGGLRYLLSSNNVNFEVLLPDVHGVGRTQRASSTARSDRASRKLRSSGRTTIQPWGGQRR